MTTLRQSEPSANSALGAMLRRMLPSCAVHSETTRAISDHPGLQPDILITADDRAPVVVEAEYMPAYTAEDEAKERLGLRLAADGKRIESAIALRYPADIADASDIDGAIRSARLEYAVFYEDDTRFPVSGWLNGGVSDLADLIRLVSVSERAVDAATDVLEQGIERAVAVLDNMGRLRPAINQEIARLLGMDDLPPTRRMACAIIANALIFHERIAGMHAEVKPLNLLWTSAEDNPRDKLNAAWDDVLQINYWAIFAIARDIVNQLPAHDAAQIIDRLRDTAQRISSGGAIFAHDLTGRIFQRLIADRKYLATFYTLPASSALLARIAVAKLKDVDWADAAAIGKLRVGDFACGTGALLSAVYEQFSIRHEHAGGSAASLHKAMMEDALYGCDVMPSAVHITGATLSGIQPNIGYENSRLYTMPYGRQADGSVKIGSLDLLQTSSVMTLFNTSDPALRTGSIGEETAAQIAVDIPDDGFDIVIMNPPFTSNTKHRDADGNILNAAFAAFGAPIADQDDMASLLIQLARGSHYHGHAGLGSAFVSIADKKVRPGGVVALVLPFTAINGSAWAKFRELIATQYTDATIVSIASTGRDMAFSSDTGIAECLIIARKLEPEEKPRQRAEFVSLTHRPAGFVESREFARGIAADAELNRLEDGPYGGVPIYCGEDLVGEALDAPIDGYATGWGAARMSDASLAQVAHSLSDGKLWLPVAAETHELPIARLSEVGQRGLDSQMVISAAHNAPFTKHPPSPTATYPALWNHNARNETRMVCVPDSQLRVRRGMGPRVAEIWATASRAHISRGFRFTAQPLSVAYTEQVSLGGRAWPNVKFEDRRFDYAFTIWGNSSLGLLCYWWHSSRQQAGRGDITVSGMDNLPILDLRALTDAQLATAQEIFDEFRELELQPAYLADADANRALLDRRVVCDMLGFDESVYEGVRMLAAKWCAEPSVHGGKRRPAGARLAV